jgi:hypothetical protein
MGAYVLGCGSSDSGHGYNVNMLPVFGPMQEAMSGDANATLLFRKAFG